MKTKIGIGLVAVALAGLGSAAAVAGSAGGSPKDPEERMKIVVAGGGATERLVLDDLDELAVGESRESLTEGGEKVTVTRDETGFDVEFASGRKLRIDQPTAGAFAFGDDPGNDDVVIVRHLGAEAGEPFAWHGAEGEVDLDATGGKTRIFVDGDRMPFDLVVEDVVDGLARSEKFQGLDAATRATVLEALRELEPSPTKTFTRRIAMKRVEPNAEQ